jgi:starch synthase (maltosyl-transferring)
MAFNWVYLNPVNEPGFSGSLYATRDYYRLNPSIVPAGAEGDGLELLRPVLGVMADRGLRPVADLVINHTSKDSPLVALHPEWYLRDAEGNVESPFAVDPDNPDNVTVWGDLAEIDNAGSADRDALWGYWTALVERYLDLGFQGFRCDAAYKVPAELWAHLVATAAGRNPEARFFAETLGAALEEVEALRASGLHYFFNSSKWWDFEAPWALEQHELFADIPSISFPETHDTARLAEESGGSEAVQRQRYAFAATYSAGLMMPIGYEFGFRRKTDVVRTTPEHWETPLFDLQRFVERVNRLKLQTPQLQGEGRLRRAESPSPDVAIVERRSDAAPGTIGWVVINTRPDEPKALSRGLPFGPAPGLRMVRPCRDGAPLGGENVPGELALDPAEVVLILGADR